MKYTVNDKVVFKSPYFIKANDYFKKHYQPRSYKEKNND